MDAIEALNQSLFLMINAGASPSAAMVSTAVLTADYLIFLIPLGLLFSWLWQPEQRALAVRACMVCLLALGLGQAITAVWSHPRPFMIGVGHTLIAHAADASFPSDHGIVFAGMALSLLLAGELGGGLLLTFTGIAVAWSRIYLGVHFPLDMLGSVLVVVTAYLILRPLWTKWGSTLMTASEGLYRHLLAWPIARGWIKA